jgi:hypothetical protein
MQVFKLKDIYELEQIKGDSVKDVLEDDSVFILSNDDSKTITIFKGPNASFPMALSGMAFCKEFRRQMKGFYKINEYETLNKEEQGAIINSKITDGRLKPIINPRTSFDLAKIVEKDGKQEYFIQSWASLIADGEELVFNKAKIADVFKRINSTKVPEGYVRSGIIIDSIYYTTATEIEQTLEGRKYIQKLHRVGTIPDGLFFEEADATRVQIYNGKVDFIELLRLSNNFSKIGKVLAPVFFEDTVTTQRHAQELIDALVPKAKPEEE